MTEVQDSKNQCEMTFTLYQLLETVMVSQYLRYMNNV